MPSSSPVWKGRLLRSGLSRHLAAHGVEVVEVNRPDRAARRRSGKTDAVDAEAAARAVLGGRATGTPKTKDGPVEELRVLKVVKDSAVRGRTQAINQLKALLVSAPFQLREGLAGLSNPRLFKACIVGVESCVELVWPAHSSLLGLAYIHHTDNDAPATQRHHRM
ncbi:transposase [Streptomyces sp. NPDC059985]|uniref:IS110 family transposase n=1 Tax=Streptomyces sp. NPDC059985 TaxID=3347025 RepID=UPI00367C22B0